MGFLVCAFGGRGRSVGVDGVEFDLERHAALASGSDQMIKICSTPTAQTGAGTC